MPVIGHETIMQKPHGLLGLGFGQDPQESGVITGIRKQLSPRIGAVENMIHQPARLSSAWPAHAANRAAGTDGRQEKSQGKRFLAPDAPFLHHEEFTACQGSRRRFLKVIDLMCPHHGNEEVRKGPLYAVPRCRWSDWPRFSPRFWA